MLEVSLRDPSAHTKAHLQVRMRSHPTYPAESSLYSYRDACCCTDCFGAVAPQSTWHQQMKTATACWKQHVRFCIECVNCKLVSTIFCYPLKCFLNSRLHHLLHCLPACFACQTAPLAAHKRGKTVVLPFRKISLSSTHLLPLQCCTAHNRCSSSPTSCLFILGDKPKSTIKPYQRL